MSGLSRILVPVDFSSGSRSALEYAAFLAAGYGAEIQLLHVIGPSRLQPRQRRLQRFATSEHGRELERYVAELRRRGLTAPRAAVEVGDATTIILAVAADGDYDLIVMGTHGHTGLLHVIIGSVAEQVVRRAPCPVLTIRDQQHLAAAGTPALAEP